MIKFIKKHIYSSIFVAIIFLSITLRFYQLGVNPPSLDWDEASSGYNAYSVLKTGSDEYGNKLPMSFRSFDDYKPPVYIYLSVPSVALFGLNEFAVRLPAAVIGVIAVIAVYFLTQEILLNLGTNIRKSIALASAFFLAVSPWHLQFSRAAFEGNVGICFLTLSLIFFFKAMKKSKYYFLFVLFFVLSLYSYHSFLLINPLLIVAVCVLFYKDLLKQKLAVSFAFLLILILSIPLYSNFIHPQGSGSRFSMVTVFSDSEMQKFSADQLVLAKKNHDLVKQIMYNRRIVFIPRIISGYLSHFNFDFLFIHGDSGVQHHAYNMGMLYLWEAPFIAIGIIYLLKRRNRRVALLFILFLLAPLPGAISTGAPHPVRAIAMIPAFQIFTSVGFVITCLFLLRRKKAGKIIIGVFIILFSINFLYYMHSYYQETPIKYGYFWQYGNREAIMYAKQHENKYSHIVMTYAYDQPYVYYLFYNKINPGWYQKNWNYSGTGIMDRFYRKIGKYEFMNISSKDKSRRNTLIMGTPQEALNLQGITKKEIKFPDGRTAYKIIAL